MKEIDVSNLLYADVTNLFVEADGDGIHNLKNVITCFKLVSGLS